MAHTYYAGSVMTKYPKNRVTCMRKIKKRDHCNLCNKYDFLEYSHIIPSFYFKNEKRRGELYFRNLKNPNKREQDGVKAYILCNECEQFFGNTIEKQFREDIYLPFDHNKINLEYDYKLLETENARRFAASISWRALVCYMLSDQFTSQKQKESFYSTERLWKEYLLNKKTSFTRISTHLSHSQSK